MIENIVMCSLLYLVIGIISYMILYYNGFIDELEKDISDSFEKNHAELGIFIITLLFWPIIFFYYLKDLITYLWAILFVNIIILKFKIKIWWNKRRR